MDDEKVKEEGPVKVPKEKYMEVRVIEKTGRSALVEYYVPKRGCLRVVIPIEIIKEGRVALSELEAGVPHGVDWAKVKVKAIDPEALSIAFRDEGIFTLKDLGERRQSALACIYRLSGLMLSDIIDQVK